MDDTYKTISAASEGEFKDKGSKFLAYAFPVSGEEQVREIVKKIKKEHFTARHHCFAWRLGADGARFRASDDGEPFSTAGKPILGQLLSNGLTDTLIVVVRYFGGILLGTSGLINAYKTAASEAIKNAEIVEKVVETQLVINFSYNELNAVMHILKTENIEQFTTDFQEKCKITATVRKSDAERVKGLLNSIYGVEAGQLSLFSD